MVPYEEISERDMAGSREGQGNARVGLDAEGAVAGKQFKDLFFPNCKCDKIAEYVKTIVD